MAEKLRDLTNHRLLPKAPQTRVRGNWKKFKERCTSIANKSKTLSVVLSLSAVTAFSSLSCNQPGTTWDPDPTIPGGYDPCGEEVALGLKADTPQELDELVGVTDIAYNLQIEYVAGLEDLKGLDTLLCVWKNLIIKGNPDLETMEGLDNLWHIRRELGITHNPRLENLAGLSALEETNILTIKYNPSLVTLEGIDSLTHIKWGDISFNESLVTLHGLETLGPILETSLSGHISIRENALLEDIDGLSGIVEMRNIWFSITDNPSLVSLEGLRNARKLTSISIESNNALQNVDGLRNLETVAGALTISNNASLQDLEGLNSLTSLGETLTITYNSSLPQEEAERIRDNLIANGWEGTAEIHHNGTGENYD